VEANSPSAWGMGGPALRLGLRLLKGFREAHAGRIVETRAKLGRFNSVEQFHQTTHLPVAALRILAEADAFSSLGLSRRNALWEVLELKDGEPGLFEGGAITPSPGTPGEGWGEGDFEHQRFATPKSTLTPSLSRSTGRGSQSPDVPKPPRSEAPDEHKEEELRIANCKLQIANLGEAVVDPAPVPPVPNLQFAICNLQSPTPSSPTPPVPPSCLPSASLRAGRASVPPCLPPMPLGQEVMTDYATAGLSLKQHPVALVRDELKRRRIICSKDLDNVPNGRWVNVAGLVLIRQRPGTASGIVFETLEDETGIVNLIVKPDIYERYRSAARHAGLLQADGYLQKQGQVVHVIAKRLFDLSELLQGHQFQSRDFH